jgi:ribose/xylose/arabinose/galactoside ABC-type transport system permease subunit
VIGVGALLLAMLGAVALVNPAFATAQNLRDLLVQSAPVIIAGCGMTLVVVSGEIDISVGSLLGLLAALMGVLSSTQHLGQPAWIVAGATLLAGAGVGLVNGVLVAVGRVPSIIATLGMLTILRGVTEIVMGGEWITDLRPDLRTLGTGTLVGVPVCLVMAAVVALLAWVVSRRTTLGVRVYAIGGNAEAARLAGVPVLRTRLVVFALSGVVTALAALVSVPQQSTVESGIGSGFELVVVTAVVVGGASVRGGSGGIIGMILAALLLGSVRSALVFLKLGEAATYWERAIQGGFILAAVLADYFGGRAGRRTSRTDRPSGAGGTGSADLGGGHVGASSTARAGA